VTWVLVLIAVTTAYAAMTASGPEDYTQGDQTVAPPMMALPESGDLGVLRIVLDGHLTELDAAREPASSVGAHLRAVAKLLLARRDAWRSAGAVDVEAGRLYEVPERYGPLIEAERERIAVLDEWRAPGNGPFRSPGDLDPRQVSVVVIVLGVRETPVLRYMKQDTLVTIGEIGRGESIAAALATIAEIGDGSIVAADVLVRHTHAGDLFRAYPGGVLVRLKT
jgi:hypothetical protein